MPKRVNYDKNPRTVELERRKRQAKTQSPECRMRQLRYLLNSIDESVRAGRQPYEGYVEGEVKRLRAKLETLEAQNV